MKKKILLLPLALLAIAVPGYGLYVYLTDTGVAHSSANTLPLNQAGVKTENAVSVVDTSPTTASRRALQADGAATKITSNSPADPAQSSAGFEVADERYSQINENTSYPTLQARMTELESIYPNLTFEPNELVDLLAEPNAWQATALPTRDLPLTDEERNDGREFIELKPERLLVALPGDLLELPIEQLGLNMEMQVERRELLPNGGFVLHGRILGSDEPMRVTLSQAPGLSIAGIETPQGHYVLQANDGHGWIASSDTLFKQDEHQHDMVIPPDHE